MLLKWVVSELSDSAVDFRRTGHLLRPVGRVILIGRYWDERQASRVTPPSLPLATTDGPFLPYRCSVAFC
jgi:hypothetical protein